MQQDRITLWRGTKTVNIRDVDLTAENLGRIFQLSPWSIYLVTESDDVVLPGPSGYLNDISNGTRYEVCGEEARHPHPQHSQAPAPAPRQHGAVFQFSRRPAATASNPGPPPPRPAARLFTRNIIMGRVENSQLFLDGAILFVEFSQSDATITAMAEKVKADLRTEETIVLCDGQGNRLVDSSGTSGLGFWKQNAKKVVALTETSFRELQKRKRRRMSLADSDAKENMEELLMAAQELPAISETLRELAQYARSNKVSCLALTETQIGSVKATMKCIICRDPMTNPVATPCCRSFIGCRICVDQWVLNEPSCPKCRDGGFRDNRFEMNGMEEILSILRDTIRD